MSLHRIALGLSLLSGCQGGSRPASVDCESLTGLDRDSCLHDALVATPADHPDLVIERAGSIKDPMVRQAAVSTWVAAHVTEIPVAKGRELCGLLEARDRAYCERRVSSPHLDEPNPEGGKR